jgi:hypothetical protein
MMLFASLVIWGLADLKFLFKPYFNEATTIVVDFISSINIIDIIIKIGIATVTV